MTRNLRLTPVRAAALSLAVAEGSEQDQLRSLARAHFLKTVGEIVDALSQGGEQRQEAVNVSYSQAIINPLKTLGSMKYPSSLQQPLVITDQ